MEFSFLGTSRTKARARDLIRTLPPNRRGLGDSTLTIYNPEAAVIVLRPHGQVGQGKQRTLTDKDLGLWKRGFDLRVSRGVDCLFTGWKHPQDKEHGFPPWALLRDEQKRDWHSFRIQPPICTPESIQGGFVQLGQLLDAVAVSDLQTKPGGDPHFRLKLIHDWIERITAGRWMPFGEFLASQDSGLKAAIPWAVEHPETLLVSIPHNSKRGDFLCALETLAKAIPPERFIDGKPGQDP